jgi:hypothetical protein
MTSACDTDTTAGFPKRPGPRRFFRALLAALCLAGFAACPAEVPDEDDEVPRDELIEEGDVKTLKTSVRNGAVKFYSLTTGGEITDPAAIASRAWDIAFKETRTIWTNSGATANHYQSGGQGAVWHTNKRDFEQAGPEDAVKNHPVYGPYNTDTIRWAPDMEAYKERYMNVMTFVGYLNEEEVDGKTRETAFNAGYLYNKRAFYTSPFMGVFLPSGYVYIIQHADGEHYSKIQVKDFIRTRTTDANAVAGGETAKGTDFYEVLIRNY